MTMIEMLYILFDTHKYYGESYSIPSSLLMVVQTWKPERSTPTIIVGSSEPINLDGAYNQHQTTSTALTVSQLLVSNSVKQQNPQVNSQKMKYVLQKIYGSTKFHVNQRNFDEEPGAQ